MTAAEPNLLAQPHPRQPRARAPRAAQGSRGRTGARSFWAALILALAAWPC